MVRCILAIGKTTGLVFVAVGGMYLGAITPALSDGGGRFFTHEVRNFAIPEPGRTIEGLVDGVNPQLLRGYDTFSSELKEKCVKYGGFEKLPEIPPSPDVTRHFTSEDGSQRDILIERLEVNVSAQIGLDGFAGKGSSKVTKEFVRAALHRYLHVYTTVEFPERTLDLSEGLELTTAAEGYLRSGSFFSHCGNTFVFGDKPGGRFDAVYLFRTATKRSFDQVKGQVDVAVASIALGASANFIKSITNSSRYSRLVTAIISQGPGDPIKEDPASIFKYGRNFVEAVRRNPGVYAYKVAQYPMLSTDDWAKWDAHVRAAQLNAGYLIDHLDRQHALEYLEEQSNGNSGYTFPQKAKDELGRLKTENSGRRIALDNCVKAANCNDLIPPFPAPAFGAPGPLVVYYPNPGDLGASLITRQERTFVEVLGRWKGLQGKQAIVCDRTTCERNRFLIKDQANGQMADMNADRTCMSSKGKDIYFKTNLTGLRKITPDTNDPVRVLAYPSLYPGEEAQACEWSRLEMSGK